MNRTVHMLFALSVLVLIIPACNALLPQDTPDSVQTQIVASQLTESAGNFPLTEADVPRVTPEEAKTALDSGAAVIMDVRDRSLYDQGHIAGAISVPLEKVENNPTAMNLEKDQWIITYCT